jgi:hypothetical protein
VAEDCYNNEKVVADVLRIVESGNPSTNPETEEEVVVAVLAADKMDRARCCCYSSSLFLLIFVVERKDDSQLPFLDNNKEKRRKQAWKMTSHYFLTLFHLLEKNVTKLKVEEDIVEVIADQKKKDIDLQEDEQPPN